jgi:hypothetical protein
MGMANAKNAKLPCHTICGARGSMARLWKRQSENPVQGSPMQGKNPPEVLTFLSVTHNHSMSYREIMGLRSTIFGKKLVRRGFG